MNQLKEKLNAELSNEELRKILYNVFCIIIFLLPVIPEVIGFGLYSLKNTLFNLVAISTAIGVTLIDIKERRFKLTLYDVLIAIYFILIIVSSILSEYGFVNCALGTYGRGEGIITIFSYIVTFIICYKGYPYIKKTFKVAIIGAIIVCIYGIIQANVPLEIKLPFGSPNTFGVAEGTMGNQNFFSSYLCMFLPMMCYYFLNTKDNKSLIVVGLMFANLVFAKTLGGYLVFIVMYIAICIFSLVYSKTRKNTVVKILLMTCVILLIFIALTRVKGNDYLEEVNQTKNEVVKLVSKDEQFATNRLAIWKRVIMAIQNNKMFGVGPECLKQEFVNEEYHLLGQEDMLNKRIVDKAHNEYLQIAVTTGIPSLAVYIVLVLIICIRLLIIVLRMHKESSETNNRVFLTMTLIAVASYLAQAFGNISVVQVAPIFWLILGLAAGSTLEKNN